MPSFKTKDGLTLAYTDEGQGPGAPLLCLAGLTRNGADFDHFVAAMGAGHRIIRLDARGRGGSDFDPDFNNYNVMTEAGDAVALLDHLSIEQVVVIGSSRGGFQAMVVAATQPQRLAGVVLNDVGPDLSQAGVTKIMGYLGLPPTAKTMAEAAEGLRESFGPQFPGTDQTFWNDWAERSYRAVPGGLALTYDPKLRDAVTAQAAAMDPKGPGLWPLFQALRPVPAIVLRAENSDLLSAETAAKMKEVKPDLVEAIIPDRGHIPRLDEPAVLSAIREFLSRLDAGN